MSLGAAEVPSALDRGVVDGLITGTVGAELWKDLLKYGYLLGLNFNNAYIIANTAAFDKLTPDEQAEAPPGGAKLSPLEYGNDESR